MNIYQDSSQNAGMDFEQKQWFIKITNMLSFDVSPDLQTVAYSQQGRFQFTIIKLRKLVVFRQIKILLNFQHCFKIKYSPNGQLLATVGNHPYIINFWNTKTSKLISRLKCMQADSFVFLPDGNSIMVINGYIVEIWSLNSKIRKNFRANEMCIQQFSITWNNYRIPHATKKENATSRSYKIGQVLQHLHRRKKIDNLLINAYFILSTHKHQVRVWTLIRCKLIRRINRITGLSMSLAISPDKKFICSCGWHSKTHILDLQTAIKYRIPGEEIMPASTIQFSFDSKFFIKRIANGLLVTPLKICTPITD